LQQVAAWLFLQVDLGRLPCLQTLPFLTSSMLRTTMGYLVQDGSKRLLVAPLISRLLRCSDADAVALKQFFSTSHTNVQPNLYFSTLLELNIELSEFWGTTTPAPPSVYADQSNALYFTVNVSGLMDAAWSKWPRYTPDQYANTFPNTANTSLLLVNGNLDPATTLLCVEQALPRLIPDADVSTPTLRQNSFQTFSMVPYRYVDIPTGVLAV
jgi:hypothetical protein